jgi:phosphoribosylformylglycinamidine (FGAM) synthase-like enzyme
VSDGGTLTAAVEMAFARRGDAVLGLRVEVERDAAQRAAACFAEAPAYLCEVRPADLDAFRALCARHGVAVAVAGAVLDAPVLEVAAGDELIGRVALADLAAIWRNGLQRVFDEGSST